jgi:hypothetical protein
MIGFCPNSPDNSHRHFEIINFENIGEERHQIGVCPYCTAIIDYGVVTSKVFPFKHGVVTNDPMANSILPFSSTRRELRMKYKR